MAQTKKLIRLNSQSIFNLQNAEFNAILLRNEHHLDMYGQILAGLGRENILHNIKQLRLTACIN